MHYDTMHQNTSRGNSLPYNITGSLCFLPWIYPHTISHYHPGTEAKWYQIRINSLGNHNFEFNDVTYILYLTILTCHCAWDKIQYNTERRYDTIQYGTIHKKYNKIHEYASEYANCIAAYCSNIKRNTIRFDFCDSKYIQLMILDVCHPALCIKKKNEEKFYRCLNARET